MDEFMQAFKAKINGQLQGKKIEMDSEIVSVMQKNQRNTLEEYGRYEAYDTSQYGDFNMQDSSLNQSKSKSATETYETHTVTHNQSMYHDDNKSMAGKSARSVR